MGDGEWARKSLLEIYFIIAVTKLLENALWSLLSGIQRITTGQKLTDWERRALGSLEWPKSPKIGQHLPLFFGGPAKNQQVIKSKGYSKIL